MYNISMMLGISRTGDGMISHHPFSFFSKVLWLLSWSLAEQLKNELAEEPTHALAYTHAH